MIVLDVTTLLPILLELPESGTVLTTLAPMLDRTRAAPHLVDIEAAEAIGRLQEADQVSARAAATALEDLSRFAINRYPHHVLLPRVLELHGPLGANAAVYLALAEVLEATLVTRDPAYLDVKTDAEVVLAV